MQGLAGNRYKILQLTDISTCLAIPGRAEGGDPTLSHNPRRLAWLPVCHLPVGTTAHVYALCYCQGNTTGGIPGSCGSSGVPGSGGIPGTYTCSNARLSASATRVHYKYVRTRVRTYVHRTRVRIRVPVVPYGTMVRTLLPYHGTKWYHGTCVPMVHAHLNTQAK